MQNGGSTYSWVGPPPALSQKSWPPGYQASLTNLFLKKNPLHFGTGISQLAAASSYLEKMSNLGSADHAHHKCPHPDAKDKPYPCDVCHKYLTLCNSLRADARATSGASPPERKALPMLQAGGGGASGIPPPIPQAPSSMGGGPQGAPPSAAVVLERANGHGPRPRPLPTKQFMCPVCHKYFTQKGNLKTHMMIHTGEKPYSCQVCGKSFTQKGNVDTHMKIHTGEKDFGCEACGKRFTQKGNLKTHVRSVHTKEKPFACGVCGKCFSQKGNMQTHMRTHNKEDRFPCTLCGKTFSQKGNLKTHMQRHAGQLPPRRYGSRGSRGANAITGGLLHRPHLAAFALASTSVQQQHQHQQHQQPQQSSSPKPLPEKSPPRGSGPPTPLSPEPLLRHQSAEDSSPVGPDPRPFYSAPPTPAPPHSPRWLVHPGSRHYDGFQAPPYPGLHPPHALSRLALLGAGSSPQQQQQHATSHPTTSESGAPSPDEKASPMGAPQHPQHTGHMGESFHSPSNPDFSQLLE